MIRLKDTSHQSTASFLSSAIKIAEYYGFSHLDEIPRMQNSNVVKNMPPLAKIESELSFARRDEKALLSSARKCLSAARRDGALLAWRTSATTTGVPNVSLELHILGPGSAIAEALLIVIANAIAEESGIKERTLGINNIGSPESSNRYVRDVGLYLRKHIESISPTLRPRAATDPLGTLVQLIEKGHPAAPRAPQAMEYLTEDERRRFWELLEYLEIFGLPYELNAHILGSRDLWSHTLWEIAMNDAESGTRVTIASGGRYDPIASRFSRSPSSAAMVSISCEIRGKTRVTRSTVRGSDAQPAIYFAHLGVEARRRALPVLEQLRHANVRLHQGLWHERIGEQMATARMLATPYIIIMGHKEAMEGTVLVREVATNSQDAIPLTDLAGYLKRHRVGAWKETHV